MCSSELGPFVCALWTVWALFKIVCCLPPMSPYRQLKYATKPGQTLLVHVQVQFIEALTNVYVRFNRTRLKGRRGEADCRMALACLYDVLLTVCKARSLRPRVVCNIRKAQLLAGTHSRLPQAMAPFTPFFCEMMYRNLRRALPPGAPESVHWCDFPQAEAAQVHPNSRPSLQPVCAAARHLFCITIDETLVGLTYFVYVILNHC